MRKTSKMSRKYNHLVHTRSADPCREADPLDVQIYLQELQLGVIEPQCLVRGLGAEPAGLVVLIEILEHVETDN